MRTRVLYAVVTAAALLLSACTTKTPDPAITINGKPLTEPGNKLVDFQLVDCDHLWDIDNEQAMSNPLYWLRATDCAVRLSPADARAEARRLSGDDWQSAFKRGVLLNNGNVTPVERRQYILQLDAFSNDYPAAIRPLLQLWRDDQMGLLQLSEERTRYAHLQQSSDAELDALRQQQIQLNKELNVTRRKLESLTDIERQLSSRRSPDASDSGRTDKSEGAEPTTNTGGAAQP